MKYTCSVDIELPREQVVALWKDEGNFKHWQDGFVKIDHLEGEPNAVRAKSRILLDQGGRKMELLETIISTNLPDEKAGLYEHTHMTNTQTTRFAVVDDNTTKYVTEVEYTEFNGFMPKLMAKLFPDMFKKQSQKWMDQFKLFAEQNN